MYTCMSISAAIRVWLIRPMVRDQCFRLPASSKVFRVSCGRRVSGLRVQGLFKFQLSDGFVRLLWLGPRPVLQILQYPSAVLTLVSEYVLLLASKHYSGLILFASCMV